MNEQDEVKAAEFDYDSVNDFIEYAMRRLNNYMAMLDEDTRLYINDFYSDTSRHQLILKSLANVNHWQGILADLVRIRHALLAMRGLAAE